MSTPVPLERAHCGICRYSYFGADWSGRPYCVEFTESMPITVGNACNRFEPGAGFELIEQNETA